VIKHIVMWSLKEELDKVETSKKVKKLLEGLKEKINEIVEIEVGINYNSSEMAYDIALYSTFKTKEDLQSYQTNPHHIEAGGYIKSVVKERTVVDYDV